MIQENPFVNYLDQFNILSPNHSKIYDEYTHSDEGFKYELKVETKIEKYLVNIFSNQPRSIILTGNAGDGKTRLCRTVHDNCSNEILEKWPASGIVEITLPSGRLRIVKDLSELTDEIIERELLQLQKCIQFNHNEGVYYLIAANEGKLTKFLSQREDLSYLRNEVRERFKSHKNNDSIFSIHNLLDVTSSTYLEKVLEGWNDEENWKVCQQCSLNNRCIIYLNHNKTSQQIVRERLVEQYRLVDFLDTHITIREMLIHISYLLTGGYTCKDIHNAKVQELKEQGQRVYYQNFYGHNSPSVAFSEMRAMRIFRELDPGDNSISVIDDFIINGDICGFEELELLHSDLFGNGLDMQFGYLRQQLKHYRDYSVENNDELIEFWIKRLRRKLYFEIPNDIFKERMNMIPLQFVADYQEMFNNDKRRMLKIKDIINGLNKAFTKRLIQNSDSLYAANENLLISNEFQFRNKNKSSIKLIQDENREDLDYISSKYTLIIEDEIRLPINLSMFEYLMRLSSGDLFHILKEDVEILIDTFKNELIQFSEPEVSALELFTINKETGLFAYTSIDLPEEEY
ncbi:hypothetical protein [Ectobacillus antri]|uniref:hypothetical protein n=1 Tax=Ectobacillus antri TaxID=2486280 RepID=UPI001FE88973|nr:hypothetical protein [Ectobacillus antri]